MASDKYALRTIRSLGRHNKGWYQLASEIERSVITKGIRAGSPTMKAWVAKAAEASGYSVNMLTRMMSVLDYVREVKATRELAGVNLDEIGFSSVELVRRLEPFNPTLARQSLRELASGGLKHRDLLARYKRTLRENLARAPSAARGKFAAASFARAGARLVRHSAEFSSMVPKGWDYMDLVPKEAPGSASLLCFDRSSIEETICGFECLKLAKGIVNESQRWDYLLHRTFFASRFYARYWLVFDVDVDEERAGRMARCFEDLGVKSIGLFMIRESWDPAGGTPEILSFCKPGIPIAPPVPDWRGKARWEQIIRDIPETGWHAIT